MAFALVYIIDSQKRLRVPVHTATLDSVAIEIESMPINSNYTLTFHT